MKYEYKTIVLRNLRAPPLTEDLETHFLDGWELIQVLCWESPYSDTNYTAYFKRELQGE